MCAQRRQLVGFVTAGLLLADALLLSRNSLKPPEGTAFAESLGSALGQSIGSTAAQGHEYARVMERIFSVGLGSHKTYAEHRKTIDLLSLAIDKSRTAQVRYFSASQLLRCFWMLDTLRQTSEI